MAESYILKLVQQTQPEVLQCPSKLLVALLGFGLLDYWDAAAKHNHWAMDKEDSINLQGLGQAEAVSDLQEAAAKLKKNDANQATLLMC